MAVDAPPSPSGSASRCCGRRRTCCRCFGSRWFRSSSTSCATRDRSPERWPRCSSWSGSLSDYYDGYLARKHGIVTTLGKFLDPLADKLLVVSVLIMLVAMPCVSSGDVPCEPRVPAWLVVLIVGRELAVTGLRSIASSEGIMLGAEELGKYKTIFQIFALTGLLLHYRYLFVDFHLGGMYFLWIVARARDLVGGRLPCARLSRGASRRAIGARREC